jgi:hypothetical protein
MLHSPSLTGWKPVPRTTRRPAPACLFITAFLASTVVSANEWQVADPVLLPGAVGSFDEVSVKDPSIVFFDGQWHLFYTARGKTEYTTGYVCAADLSELQSARRHELAMIRGKTRYGCAPQVFYFAPQRIWYLIFQHRDANYQPAFSKTRTIADPKSWSRPAPLIEKDAQAKWIDFWVICDESRAYLFYTQAHRGVVVRSTALKEFPDGWNQGRQVFDDVHEAVHVYRAGGRGEFHMIYERNNEGVRSFGLAKAKHLQGPWHLVTEEYANGNQLQYIGDANPWTEMVSHGEAIRTGYDQTMEYDATNCRWLIQGILRDQLQGPYPTLPWRLGVIQQMPHAR